MITAIAGLGVSLLGQIVVDKALGSSGSNSDSSKYGNDLDIDFDNDDIFSEEYITEDEEETSSNNSENLTADNEEAKGSPKRPHDTRGYERKRFGKVEHVSGYSTGKNKKK